MYIIKELDKNNRESAPFGDGKYLENPAAAPISDGKVGMYYIRKKIQYRRKFYDVILRHWN